MRVISIIQDSRLEALDNFMDELSISFDFARLPLRS